MRHYVYLNTNKTRDALVQAYYDKTSSGESFSEFVKQALYDVARKNLSKKELNALLLGGSAAPPPNKIQTTQTSNTTPSSSNDDGLGDLLDDFGGI
jgi:hypothetical protein